MNMCFLCLPCALAVFNPAPEVRFMEAFGLCLWLLSYSFENISDLQKSNFLTEVKRYRLEHKLTEKSKGITKQMNTVHPCWVFHGGPEILAMGTSAPPKLSW